MSIIGIHYKGKHRSVKVIVDAYDGNVDYYISDSSDPIIRAYSSAYPGLFKHQYEIPQELRKHLRYPRDLYYMQMKVYARYHQRSPALFYEQAETWVPVKVRGQPVLPYYQTMDFGNCNNKEEFVMIDPMTPINRANLCMIGNAGIMDKTLWSAFKRLKQTYIQSAADSDGAQTPEAIFNPGNN